MRSSGLLWGHSSGLRPSPENGLFRRRTRSCAGFNAATSLHFSSVVHWISPLLRKTSSGSLCPISQTATMSFSRRPGMSLISGAHSLRQPTGFSRRFLRMETSIRPLFDTHPSHSRYAGDFLSWQSSWLEVSLWLFSESDGADGRYLRE